MLILRQLQFCVISKQMLSVCQIISYENSVQPTMFGMCGGRRKCTLMLRYSVVEAYYLLPGDLGKVDPSNLLQFA